MRGWVVVFSGEEGEAAAAVDALGGAGIEAVSAPARNRLAEAFELATPFEVAVPRRNALEAAHVLRSDQLTFTEQPGRERSRRPLLALVAVVVIVALVLLAVLVLLPGGNR